MKFSIVVPTMWMANKFFLPMLEALLKCNVVGEIIIIDNNSKDRPEDDSLKHEKVKILDYGRNLYYNQSMNVGAKESQYELLALINDDIIFDPIALKVMAHMFTQKPELKETIGMIYAHPGFFNRYKEQKELLKDLKLVECTQTLDGFGCCMIMLKEHYNPIPQELVQHFGDVWYHQTNLKAKRKNFWMYNWVIITRMRATTEKVPEVRNIINNDWDIVHKVFEKYDIQLEQSKTRPVFKQGLLKQN